MNPFQLIDLLGGAALALTMSLFNMHDIPYPTELESAVAVEFSDSPWGDQAKRCRYQGLIVPYARDWEETSSNFGEDGGTVRAPEPNKVEAYALVVNRKVCPDVEDESMMSIGYIYAMRKTFYRDILVKVKDVGEYKADALPKWYPQVSARIQRLAETNEDARGFMDFTKNAQNKATNSSVPPAAEMQAPAATENVAVTQ